MTNIKFKNFVKEGVKNILLKEKKLTKSKAKSAKDEKEEEVTDDVEVGGGNDSIQVDPNIERIQKALNVALKGAQKLGDQKLIKQVGNTLTFLTRMQINQGSNLNEGFATPEGDKFKEIFEVLGEVTGTEYDDFDSFIEDNPGASEVLMTWIEENFDKELLSYFIENEYTKDQVEELGLYSIADDMEKSEEEGEDEEKSKDLNEFVRMQELAGINEGEPQKEDKDFMRNQIQGFLKEADLEQLKDLATEMDLFFPEGDMSDRDQIDLEEDVDEWLEKASFTKLEKICNYLEENNLLEYGLEHDPEKVEDEDFDHPTLEKRKKLKEELSLDDMIDELASSKTFRLDSGFTEDETIDDVKQYLNGFSEGDIKEMYEELYKQLYKKSILNKNK